MADFRALAAALGTTNGALATAAEIAALIERLKSASDNAEKEYEVAAIRQGLEHVNFVLGQIRLGTGRRIAQLERALGQSSRSL